MKQQAFLIDCMEYMRTVPDKYFDLAVVDPPYGGGATVEQLKNWGGAWRTPNAEERSRFGGRFDKYHIGNTDRRDVGGEIPPTTNGLTAPEIKAARTGSGHNKYGKLLNKELGAHFVGRGRSKRYADGEREYKAHRQNSPGGQWKNYPNGADIRHWDVAPPKEYFDELARISKNQIIWGGNYFGLPPTRCFLVWRKLTISEKFTMAMCEYAWTNFNDNAKWFECAPQGTAKDERFHPTQKPVALYRWIFQNYAHAGDKIFDSHLGSGSSRIAAYDLDLEFVGCEIDEYYFTKQEERFAKYTAQQRIEIPSQLPPKAVQTSIFDE